MGEWRGHTYVRAAALAAAVACILAVATATPAIASGGGTIEGKVSEVGSGSAIAGVEVCAYPDIGEEEEPTPEQVADIRCGTTNSAGEYVLKEMRPGPYFVSFEVPEGSALDYVSQEYGGASPTPVVVVESQTDREINAQLAHGGLISGVVTSAGTGAPIEGAFVCAVGSEGATVGVGTCSKSGGGGVYTLSGLPAGSYKVIFVAPGYAPQAYKESATLVTAESVSVEVLKTVGGIDAALTPASTTSSLGSGTGTGTTKPSGSEPLKAPGGSTHGSGGSAVPPLTLSARRLRISRHGVALVLVRCAASTACSGRITITVEEAVRLHGREHREAVTIAAGPVVALAARGRLTARVDLNARGRALLRSHRGHLSAKLNLTAPGHHLRVSVELHD